MIGFGSKMEKVLLRRTFAFLALLGLLSGAREIVTDQQVSNLLTLPITSPSHPDYSCPQPATDYKRNNFHIRGTALGGWLVIEPWLTPSLFYQFLGASQKWGDEANKHVGIDCFTFCSALGDAEANRQLRNHWKTWLTEEHVRKLARSGVEHLRIPVADWMFVPYEPFIGCWDGALEELDRALLLCQKYDIKVLIDLHAVRHSQNGLDNSGDTGHYRWIGNLTSAGAAVYEHWLQRGGDWAGPFNVISATYDSIDSVGILNSLHVINVIVDRYKDNPVVMGIEPINEPWDKIPMDILKEFYWRSYQIVQLKAPHWLTLLHDSFRLTLEHFGTFLQHCDNFAIDTHVYQAWAWENPARWFQEQTCEDRERLMAMERAGVPIVVGEWSLATDNCAMWLNGFNDNVPGYPKVQCERVRCPDPYMGIGVQPNAPPDPTLPAQDPFGAGGQSYVEFGTCPRDRPFPNDLEEVRLLALAKLHAFDFQTHGQFFWNFRTEFEPRWDFLQAVELGWIPRNWSDPVTQKAIATGCDAFLSHTARDAAEAARRRRSLSLSLLAAGIVMLVVCAVLLGYAFITKERATRWAHAYWPWLFHPQHSHPYTPIIDEDDNTP